MKFWEWVTGRDMDRTMASLTHRIGQLPAPYQQLWQELSAGLFAGSRDFSGRKVVAIMVELADYIEEGAADQVPVATLVGGDRAAFVRALLAGDARPTLQDGWRRQLNRRVRSRVAAYREVR